MWGCATPAVTVTSPHFSLAFTLVTSAAFASELRLYCIHCLGHDPFIELRSDLSVVGLYISDVHG